MAAGRNAGGGRRAEGLLACLAHDKVREAAGVLAMAGALLLAVSLLTFDPRDPSFFTYASGPGRQAHNYAGRIGGHLAGDLFGILGFGALALPPLAFLLGWWAFRGPGLTRLGLKAAACLLALLAMTTLADLLTTQGWLPRGPLDRSGGFVGAEIHRLGRPWLGAFGLYLGCATGFALALILGAQPSLRELEAGAAAAVAAGVRRLAALWPPRAARRAPPVVKAPAASGARRSPAEAAAAALRPPAEAPERMPKTDDRPSDRPSREPEAAAPPQQAFSFLPPKEGYRPPPMNLLDPPTAPEASTPDEELQENAEMLTRKLQEFGVPGEVTAIHRGPVITVYEIEPAPGIKINRIVALADDLALALKAMSVRVVAPIPGKAAVGVEIPNRGRATVTLREVLETDAYRQASGRLPIALGKDISGAPVVTDLAKMPHLLIAGATGSGKSVCLNALLLSLLMRVHPDEVKLLLVDPKRVEMGGYNGIPHLVERVVADPRDASRRLQQVVTEMEQRYKRLAELGARDIVSYNTLVTRKGEPAAAGAEERPFPYIVVFIDELSDLMMVASQDVENAIVRLAQMARAVGIHLIVATQRPSVDVITGLIKANLPTRLSFRVASKVDSRTILDQNGAEQLLGSGDMLFIPPGSSKPMRIHGGYVSEIEVQRVVKYLQAYRRPEAFRLPPIRSEEPGEPGEEAEEDALFPQAVDVVVQSGQASISMLQRRMRIGFNRAGRLIERMEREGIVGPMEGGRREILIPATKAPLGEREKA